MSSMPTPKAPGQLNEQPTFLVATFYCFTNIPHVAEMKARIETLGQQFGILGTVLIAAEGVNSTVCGERGALLAWQEKFRQLHSDFMHIQFRHTKSQVPPFRRWRVKIRPEIVTLGIDGIDPTSKTGEHVSPDRWDELIQRDDVRVIDTRNHYEYQLGSFARAEDPQTDNFREFPEWVQQNLDPEKDEHVAMFCTGGIRCEKATAYMLQQGFKNVYQLDGGILEYIKVRDQAQSLWQGECFIFDDRVSLDHSLEPTGRQVCCACRKPFDEAPAHDNEDGICPSCLDGLTEKQLAGVRERMRQVKLSLARGAQHLAPQKTLEK